MRYQRLRRPGWPGRAQRYLEASGAISDQITYYTFRGARHPGVAQAKAWLGWWA
jgi:hypothetical protein